MTLRIFRNTKNPNFLHILETSDNHLGHNKTTADFICNNLIELIPDNEETGELDVIFIAGDFFDREVMLKEENVVTPTEVAIIYLLKLCAKWDIVLRVLEGTPSHDRKQGYLFTHLNTLHDFGCDVKYFKTLDIEFMDKFGISVLYIPDEWTINPNDTYLQVLRLMKKLDIDAVDFAVMHGAFEHQYPEHLELPTHTRELYETIVRYYIFIGHVHFHSILGKVIAAGSSDRLAFGEEDPKGLVKVKVRGEQLELNEIRFIENKNAAIYNTYDVTGLEQAVLMEFLNSKLKGLPTGSRVRLLSTRNCPAYFLLKALMTEFPNIIFSHKAPASPVKKITGDLLKPISRRSKIRADKTTIKTIIMERMRANPIYTEENIIKVGELLDKHGK